MKGSRGRVTNLFGPRHGFSMRFNCSSSVSHSLIENNFIFQYQIRSIIMRLYYGLELF